MIRLTRLLPTGLLLLATVLLMPARINASGSEDTSKAETPDTEKYLLRYRFQPGETLRWQVSHLVDIRTSVSGTSQTAETLSESVKVSVLP